MTACSKGKPEFRGVDISEVDYARDIQLPDHNGQQRSLKDFKGKVAVVFFGYTQCPDVCPTTMQEMAEVKRMLGKDGDRLQAIFVTVDPAATSMTPRGACACTTAMAAVLRRWRPMCAACWTR